jgi:hypothetical protein
VPSPRSRRRVSPVLARCLVAVLACTACDRSNSPADPNPAPSPAEAVFVVRACADGGSGGELFRILVRDPHLIAQATALVGAGHRKIVTGPLRSGDGGFNTPWRWHLAPESLDFVDLTIELCDGCPHDLEADLSYWLGTVGRYCPWSSEIMARER